ncbi:hypothetical protein FRB96_009036 [Tulasnella sp. 330]|nr:hypothetical protein FRB96_009036 [Tulasnella sp. 330]KAG8873950.1 hypothetical protein FRB97_006338 [Tulasnella sp. 331]
MSLFPTSDKTTTKPSDYQTEIYTKGVKGIKPRFSFDVSQWGLMAKEVLPANSWGYVHGSAGSRETDDNNIAAFRKWALVPNRLVPTRQPDLKTKILGFDIPYPIALAPVGVLKIFHDEAESGVAAAATEVNVPYTMSTAAATSIEDVAKASGNGLRFYQLYWPPNEHNDITASILKRAADSGFQALFVTLDTYILGWRPEDENHGFNPFLKPDCIGVDVGFTDPVYREHFKKETGNEVEDDMGTAAVTWAHLVFPGYSHSWEDIAFLKEHWKGPIVLKGIQTVRDAKKAVEVGVQGIVVSNHGGRQVDGCVASLDMLPEIAEAVGDKIDIIYDSGIRSGADIAKALALGAKACLIGRPYVYGLAFGGKDGVAHVLKALLGELDLTLQLAGIASVQKEHLNRDCLRRTDA